MEGRREETQKRGQEGVRRGGGKRWREEGGTCSPLLCRVTPPSLRLCSAEEGRAPTGMQTAGEHTGQLHLLPGG